MEETYLKVIENSLDSLDKLTIWILSTFLVVLITIFSSKKELTIGTFTIKRKYGGVVLYIMLCGLIFYIFKLLNNLNSAYNSILSLSHNFQELNTSIAKARLIMHSHTWVFNPFSQTNTSIGSFTDNIGYPMLIVIWWFGNALAQVTLSSHSILLRLIGLTCALVYLTLGLGCMILIGELTAVVCEDDKTKGWVPFVGILLGALLAFIILAIARSSSKSSTNTQIPS